MYDGEFEKRLNFKRSIAMIVLVFVTEIEKYEYAFYTLILCTILPAIYSKFDRIEEAKCKKICKINVVLICILITLYYFSQGLKITSLYSAAFYILVYLILIYMSYFLPYGLFSEPKTRKIKKGRNMYLKFFSFVGLPLIIILSLLFIIRFITNLYGYTTLVKIILSIASILLLLNIIFGLIAFILNLKQDKNTIKYYKIILFLLNITICISEFGLALAQGSDCKEAIILSITLLIIYYVSVYIPNLKYFEKRKKYYKLNKYNQVVEEKYKCGNCGKMVSSTDKFCKHCGASFE